MVFKGEKERAVDLFPKVSQCKYVVNENEKIYNLNKFKQSKKS
jgi:hypothetical protein